jgi:hypothetical protein
LLKYIFLSFSEPQDSKYIRVESGYPQKCEGGNFFHPTDSESVYGTERERGMTLMYNQRKVLWLVRPLFGESMGAIHTVILITVPLIFFRLKSSEPPFSTKSSSIFFMFLKTVSSILCLLFLDSRFLGAALGAFES